MCDFEHAAIPWKSPMPQMECFHEPPHLGEVHHSDHTALLPGSWRERAVRFFSLGLNTRAKTPPYSTSWWGLFGTQWNGRMWNGKWILGWCGAPPTWLTSPLPLLCKRGWGNLISTWGYG